MFALYEIATGQLKGASRLPIDNPKPGEWAVKEVEGPHRVWNSETLQFDDFPTKPKPLTPLEFLKRFSFTEVAGIIGASKTNPMVAAVEKYFDAAEEVILDDPLTVQGIATYRDLGILTPERAAQILGGENV